MKQFRLLGLLLALLLVAAACGGDDEGDSTSTTAGATTTTAADDVDLNQGSDLTFHMVTHSDDGTFWSVVKKGMEDACEALGVNCVWSPSFNDPSKQVSDIEAAVAAGSNGIGVSLAAPDAVVPAATDAVNAGIPVVTLNSGQNDYQSIGAITHIGQSEVQAGQGAGLRFNDLGATKVFCAQQEQGNVGLEERCDGVADTFNGTTTKQFAWVPTPTPRSRSTRSSRRCRPIRTSTPSSVLARSSPSVPWTPARRPAVTASSAASTTPRT